MGMVAVLDRIQDALETLHERDTAELLARYPQIVLTEPSIPAELLT
jgi:hypothetical protein